jgi:hypothetical protein
VIRGSASNYCAFHSWAAIAGQQVAYAWIPDMSAPDGCAGQTRVSPNRDVNGDCMVDNLAHELGEAATDPFVDAYYDSDGDEMADKCSLTYGHVAHLSNGAKTNLFLNGRHYLVQRLFTRTDSSGRGICAMRRPN